MGIEFTTVENRLKRGLYRMKREVEDRIDSGSKSTLNQDQDDLVLLTMLLTVLEGYYEKGNR